MLYLRKHMSDAIVQYSLASTILGAPHCNLSDHPDSPLLSSGCFVCIHLHLLSTISLLAIIHLHQAHLRKPDAQAE